jgi:chemotaxis protein MotA
MNGLSSLLGLLGGFFIISLGIIDFNTGQWVPAFFNLQGLSVVLGGTLCATMINYPINLVLGMFKPMLIALTRQTSSPETVINQLVHLNTLHRDRGMLALEEEVCDLKNHYMFTGMQEVLIQKDSATLQQFMENEMHSIRLRHQTVHDMFYNMASYAPAFGMLGTVMGLILMMTQQSQESAVAVYSAAQGGLDPMTKMLEGMGLALVTTFYGVLFSNLLFIPIAGKLKTLSDEEMWINDIIMSGVVSLHQGDSPQRMKENLLTFVSRGLKQKISAPVRDASDE